MSIRGFCQAEISTKRDVPRLAKAGLTKDSFMQICVLLPVAQAYFKQLHSQYSAVWTQVASKMRHRLVVDGEVCLQNSLRACWETAGRQVSQMNFHEYDPVSEIGVVCARLADADYILKESTPQTNIDKNDAEHGQEVQTPAQVEAPSADASLPTITIETNPAQHGSVIVVDAVAPASHKEPCLEARLRINDVISIYDQPPSRDTPIPSSMCLPPGSVWVIGAPANTRGRSGCAVIFKSFAKLLFCLSGNLTEAASRVHQIEVLQIAWPS